MKKHSVKLTIGENVFEGIGPFLGDLDGDGLNEVVTTLSDKVKGASIAVFGFRKGELVKVAQNPYLGKRPQWLSHVGIADFNNDGVNEVAVVEKPHGGNVFAVWKLKGDELVEVAKLQGPTNHVEGTDHFQSALRKCGDNVEVILSDHEWSSIYSLKLMDGKVHQEKVGDYSGPESIFAMAAKCK